MTHTPLQIRLWEQRPFSWSQLSTWMYDKSEWYSRYILGNITPSNPAMEFGKNFANSVEWGTPMAPVDILPEVEYKLEATLDKVPLIGFIDSYDPHTRLREYKTGKAAWTQKKVDEHKQLTFYALMLHLIHNVNPKDLDIQLQWIPTCEQPDFTFGFALDKDGGATIHTFDTRRSMKDILTFGNEIKAARKEMQDFIHSKES